jgi:Ca-activated chloride channel family protein
MRLRSRAWVVAGLGWALVGWAQHAAPIERAERQPVEAWPQVRFDVTVMGRDDEPVKGLTAGQMEIRDNGQVVSGATLIAAGDEPQSICLLVDTSGSNYDKLDAIRVELLALIRDLPASDEVCAIDFSIQAYMDVAPTMDRRPLVKWVDSLRASGGTALRDALRGAAMELESHARYRSRAIVLIGDGGENASKCSEAQMLEALHAIGGPVLYSVINGNAEDERDHADRVRLQGWTAETGGLVFPIRHRQDEDAAVARLMRVLSGRYRLVYTPPDTAADGKGHRLEVQLTQDLRKQKLKVVVARGYDAAGQ